MYEQVQMGQLTMIEKPKEVPQPEKWERCTNDKHWSELIIFGSCRECQLNKVKAVKSKERYLHIKNIKQQNDGKNYK